MYPFVNNCWYCVSHCRHFPEMPCLCLYIKVFFSVFYPSSFWVSTSYIDVFDEFWFDFHTGWETELLVLLVYVDSSFPTNNCSQHHLSFSVCVLIPLTSTMRLQLPAFAMGSSSLFQVSVSSFVLEPCCFHTVPLDSILNFEISTALPSVLSFLPRTDLGPQIFRAST